MINPTRWRAPSRSCGATKPREGWVAQERAGRDFQSRWQSGDRVARRQRNRLGRRVAVCGCGAVLVDW